MSCWTLSLLTPTVYMPLDPVGGGFRGAQRECVYVMLL